MARSDSYDSSDAWATPAWEDFDATSANGKDDLQGPNTGGKEGGDSWAEGGWGQEIGSSAFPNGQKNSQKGNQTDSPSLEGGTNEMPLGHLSWEVGDLDGIDETGALVGGLHEDAVMQLRREMNTMAEQFEREREEMERRMLEMRDEALVREGEARERALAEGEALGRATERERLEGVLGAVTRATKEVVERSDEWVGNAESNLALLAVTVAREIVGRELRLESDVVRDIVRRAIGLFPLSEAIRVHVHPEDLAIVQEFLTSDGDRIEGRMGDLIEWVSDSVIERGGVRVEGRDRIVDGRLDVVLEGAYRRLSGEL